MQSKLAVLVLGAAAPFAALAADVSAAHSEVIQLVETHAAAYRDVSRKVWEFAEMGYQEKKSSALLQATLAAAGFDVKAGVAEIPTAFVASWGQGKPVIGILGEFDSLPGLSQDAVPERKPLIAGAPGHGCGHNLLGAGGALATVSIKDYLAAHRLPGTVRYYGTPAEEGGSGKVYMVRAGLFNDVDVVLHWHPGDSNTVTTGAGMLAVITAKFEFHGLASHAAASPEKGRSALDGLMIMSTAVEFLREHVPSATRIHYIVTKGGAAPNIVPDDAELFLYARHPSMTVLSGIWERILKCANGAAMATETTVECRIVSSDANIVNNTPLSERVYRNFTEIGGLTYTPVEETFAEKLVPLLPAGTTAKLGSERLVQPLERERGEGGGASTDVGDVSWNVPTIGITAATWVPGTPAHTWYATAASGMAIGQDGMVLAAKVLAVTAQDLFTEPALLAAAKADFAKRMEGLQYESKIPLNQRPPLDYRNSSK
ncbi:MAG: amidohydrolase [Bryobacteraceae bacterium]|jgi:aminobenzoyl-glutamate utilization protein B